MRFQLLALIGLFARSISGAA